VGLAAHLLLAPGARLPRRHEAPAGSEAEAIADKVVTSWIAVAVIDAMFVVIGLASRVIATPP